MRIIQIVTLVSRNGAFGGPVSVAFAQSRELARRGHAVRLFAGWDGVASPNAEPFELVLRRARKLIPTPGFSGLISMGLFWDLWRNRRDIDMVHVHLGRDFVTLPLAAFVRCLRIPYIVQTHGMIGPDQRVSARMLDALLTRRVLRGAGRCAFLTAEERAALEQLSDGSINSTYLPNGVPSGTSSDTKAEEFIGDKFIGQQIVVFCARLHPRKRVMDFAYMATELIKRGSTAIFQIYGPDEGDLEMLSAYLLAGHHTTQIQYNGALSPEQVRDVLKTASIFVLPSEKEPFPMTLLEALAVGTPSVVTEGCMIADLVRHRGVVVADDGPHGLADAVERLLLDPSFANQMSAAAVELVTEVFSISSTTDELEVLYRESMLSTPAKPAHGSRS